MHGALGVDSAASGNERLACDVAAEHPLPVVVGTLAPKHVVLDGFEVEKIDELVEGRSHLYIVAETNGVWLLVRKTLDYGLKNTHKG